MEKLNYQAKDDVLKKSFNQALKNEEFRSFVEKLHVPVETLMKYTSLLEESALEYNHCKNCKNLLACQNKVPGYAYLPEIKKQKLVFSYQACKYQNKHLKEMSYLKNIYTFSLPEAIKEAKMKNIYKKDASRFPVITWLSKFIDEYPNNKKGLYLHGSFGSGKTYLISAAFNELAKRGVKSAIVFWPEFLNELKGTFNSYNNEYIELMNKIKDAPLLLIDDLGAENLTAWARDDVLCQVLQHRMDNHLITFITTNYELENLENHLSLNGKDSLKAKRIIERVKQLTVPMELTSKNLRN